MQTKISYHVGASYGQIFWLRQIHFDARPASIHPTVDFFITSKNGYPFRQFGGSCQDVGSKRHQSRRSVDCLLRFKVGYKKALLPSCDFPVVVIDDSPHKLVGSCTTGASRQLRADFKE